MSGQMPTTLDAGGPGPPFRYHELPMELMRLMGIPVPHMLEAALGYAGDSRYVAFWWEPAGDELGWDDGRSSTVGAANWYAWLMFVQHPSVEPYLLPYELGSSDTEALHALV